MVKLKRRVGSPEPVPLVKINLFTLEPVPGVKMKGIPMNNDIIISILTPAYNAADTLPLLYETICSQTFQQFEWIVVNDGSTDNTLDVLNQLAKESSFPFLLFDQDNQGVSQARNRALYAAKGQYIFFADADDYLNPDTLDVLYQVVSQGYDFAFGNHIPQWKDGTVIRDWSFPYSSHVFKDIKKLFKRICTREIRIFASTGLYKRSIIQEFSLSFNTSLTHTEDDLFLYQYLCYCTNAVHINRNIYHYVLGSKNSIYIINQNRMKGTAKALDILLETIRKQKLPERFAKAFENCVFREKFSLLFYLYFKQFRSLDFLELPEIKALEKRITRITFNGLKGLKDLIRLKGFYLIYNRILN